MHCMNCMFVDHDGLFVYVDAGYPGSVYDVTTLQASLLHRLWRQAFRRTVAVLQYLLGGRRPNA